MAAPVIDITNYTRSRISAVAGADFSDVTFSTNQDLVNWEARAGGAGLGQGLLVGGPDEVRETWSQWDALALTWSQLDSRGYTFGNMAVVLAAGVDGAFRVDNWELTQGDKIYRIDVYGKNAAGEWTPYAG